MKSPVNHIDTVIVGGGAAGFFAAIRIKEYNPDAQVAILEKTSKVLSKVLISGGGRCNVTHNPALPLSQFAKCYPRGEKLMKKLLGQFSAHDTVEWFSQKGIRLKVEVDGRMFPITDSSSTIANCLLDSCSKLNIPIHFQTGVKKVSPSEDGFLLETTQGQISVKQLIIASGGSPKADGLDWLKVLGHKIESPVPSLFTFNIPTSTLKGLEGVSIPDARVKIAGLKQEYSGPMLVTHWGISGPAVLKLSAFCARELANRNYQFRVLIQWHAFTGEEEVRSQLMDYKQLHPKRICMNYPLFDLPRRLWERLIDLSGIGQKPFAELSKKELNKLIENLVRFQLDVSGKTTFKDEFVTCGGVSLESIHIPEMESRSYPNLYFCGEVLDVDGITGGFNFQAAWSTGDAVARAIHKKSAGLNTTALL